jgi:hypothetical protein
VALYRTADGKWGIDYRDEWGVRHRRPVGTEAAARAIHLELLQHKALARASLTHFAAGETFSLADARDSYLAHLPVSDRTRWNVRQRIDRLISFTGNAAIGQPTSVETSDPCRLLEPCHEHNHCVLVEFQPPRALTPRRARPPPRSRPLLQSPQKEEPLSKQNPKLPGMPGPPAAALANHERIMLAVAELHRALSPLLEQLPPGADTALSLHFTVMGDSLALTLKPKKE